MREEKVPTVYILASNRHGTLYIGVTSDLCSRIAGHKQGMIAGFTQKYAVKSSFGTSCMDRWMRPSNERNN